MSAILLRFQVTPLSHIHTLTYLDLSNVRLGIWNSLYKDTILPIFDATSVETGFVPKQTIAIALVATLTNR